MNRLLWTQKQDIGPSPRSSASMTFDSARSKIVLFGGNDFDNLEGLNDTWEWDGSYWTQKSNIGPAKRTESALAFDTARKKVILFGGSRFNDTWEWDGETWTEVANGVVPPRQGHAMAYDEKRKKMVLFGGQLITDDNSMFLQDTWEWDGFEWSEMADTGPDLRKSAMAYDPIRSTIILFSGVTTALEIVDSDTWEWDGVNWKKISDIGPGKRGFHKMVTTNKGIILFGGIPEIGPVRFRDTWEWDGKFWTQKQDGGPAPRASHSMAYDITRNCVVLFGGEFNGPPLGDTWELTERL